MMTDNSIQIINSMELFLVSVPAEVILTIAKYVETVDIGHWSQTCQYFRELLNDPSLWRFFYQRNFSDHCNSRDPHHQYLTATATLRHLSYPEAVMKACACGYERKVEAYLRLTGPNHQYVGNPYRLSRKTLIQACGQAARHGHWPILQQFFEFEPRLEQDDMERWEQSILGEAAEGGHRDLVETLIARGYGNINRVLCHAATGGHRELVETALARGATDIHFAMFEAAEHGHRQLVDRFLELGLHRDLFEGSPEFGRLLSMDTAMLHAARGGHLDLVKTFEGLARTSQITWISVLSEAVRHGHDAIIDYILAKGVVNWFDSSMAKAAWAGRLDLVERFRKLGAKNYDEALAYAARGNQIPVMDHLINLGARSKGEAIIRAIQYGNTNAVLHLISHGYSNLEYIVDVVGRSCQWSILEEIIKRRPKYRKRILELDLTGVLHFAAVWGHDTIIERLLHLSHQGQINIPRHKLIEARQCALQWDSNAGTDQMNLQHHGYWDIVEMIDNYLKSH
jgi:hypothetical protein